MDKVQKMDTAPKISSVLLILFLVFPCICRGADQDFYELEAGFKNFIQCELTRPDARDHFKGKNFSVTMVDLFDITRELDIIILNGIVKCDVQGKSQTLYLALGLRELKGKKKVSYCTIRNKDFRILATELLRYPYKERCPWTRYWIDLK